MKKLYISPKAVAFNVEAEAQLMVGSLGINERSGDIEGGMTREQNTNSPWDDWSE